eukprot:3929523-Rhodomonas_salina.2
MSSPSNCESGGTADVCAPVYASASTTTHKHDSKSSASAVLHQGDQCTSVPFDFTDSPEFVRSSRGERWWRGEVRPRGERVMELTRVRASSGSSFLGELRFCRTSLLHFWNLPRLHPVQVLCFARFSHGSRSSDHLPTKTGDPSLLPTNVLRAVPGQPF